MNILLSFSEGKVMMYKVMSILVLCLGIEIFIVIKKMDKLHEAYKTLSQKEKVRATAVAFSVSGPRSYDNTLKQYYTIHINIGDDFCPETGVFTCSKEGVYYFISTLTSKASSRRRGASLNCFIFKNSSQVLSLNSQYLDLRDFGIDVNRCAGSNSVVLPLSVGDTVFVGGCSDPHIDLEPWSSFSGFLLYPLI